jgi:hypothetical protein
MKMADISIETNGMTAEITVDGVKLRNVVELGFNLNPRELPVVTVGLYACENTVDMKGATLKIGGIHAPEALERAMLTYLQDKYPHTDEYSLSCLFSAGSADDEESVGDHFFPLVQDAIALMQSPGSDLIEVVSTWGAVPEHVEPPSPLTRVAPIGVRPL